MLGRQESKPMEHAKILLADDERAITSYLAPILEHAGFRVTVAADGEMALRLILEQQPDVAVLDVLMPGLIWRGLSPFASSN